MQYMKQTYNQIKPTIKVTRDNKLDVGHTIKVVAANVLDYIDYVCVNNKLPR